ncbi:uncharacterized protein LOC144647530 [Oculina patagonica]
MGQKESRRELVGGLDLVQAAKSQLDFLALVDEHPGLFSGPVLKNAIRRYEHLWLPLIFHYQSMHKKTDLAAPLDIAWVWHVHMLAPQNYEQDCNNIVSMLVDHRLLTPHQRQVGLQRAKSVWKKTYPYEPFEINVYEDPCLVQTYSSRIKYNLEEACQRQFKFYYQVSLPHYRDSRFLKDAVDRYMTHLRLKKNNPDVFLVPCYDFDLIWHAHQLHPTKYKQTTTKLLGRILKHDDSVTDRTAGSKLYDSAIKTREIWKEADCSFDKAGAMYRGDPPDPKTAPHEQPVRSPLETSTEYQVYITKAEGINFDEEYKPISIRLADHRKTLVFSQVFTKRSAYSIPFIVNEERMIKIALCEGTWYENLKIKNLSAIDNVKIMNCLSSFQVKGTRPWTNVNRYTTLDVGISQKSRRVRLTVYVDFVRFRQHSITLEPCTFFTQFDHPIRVLSCPKLMLSPEDMTRPLLLCETFDEEYKPISIRLADHRKTLVFSQVFTKRSAYSIPFIVNEERMIKIALCEGTWYENLKIKNLSAIDNVKIMNCLSSFQVKGTRPWTNVNRYTTLDVGISQKSRRVRLTVYVDFVRFRQHSITLEPCTFFTQFDHPIRVLSCPKLMLSPEDMTRPLLLCETSTHRLLDSTIGNELFQCRVVHSNQGSNPLSAVEIVDLDGKTVASSHVLSPTALPHICAIERKKTCVYLDEACNGERAMLVRGEKDYGVCIGKWREMDATNGDEPNCFVEIKFFRLQGKQGWCKVRKFKGGLYQIDINSNSFMTVDIKEGIITTSPFCQDLPEILALALSVSILYLLCKPYVPKESRESWPCYHIHRQADRLSPMILAAGYYSTMVPTNTALMCKPALGFHDGPNLKYASYDLDKEFGSETEEDSRRGKAMRKAEKLRIREENEMWQEKTRRKLKEEKKWRKGKKKKKKVGGKKSGEERRGRKKGREEKREEKRR